MSKRYVMLRDAGGSDSVLDADFRTKADQFFTDVIGLVQFGR
jgi:hypothetical protein